MPFISIQSFYRQVATVVPQAQWRITNWVYDDPLAELEVTAFGYSEIADSGEQLIAGAPNRVNVYERLTGPGEPWSGV